MIEPDRKRAREIFDDHQLTIIDAMVVFAREHAAAVDAQARREGAIEELERLAAEYEKYAASATFEPNEKNVYWEERDCHLIRIQELRSAKWSGVSGR